MTIRKGTEKDIIDLCDLWLDMVHEVTPGQKPNLQWWVEETLGYMDDEDYLCYVAEDDGQVIGFTDGLIQKDAGIGKLIFYSRHTSIHPEHRHGETVKGLFLAISNDARKKGAHSAMFCCDVSLIRYWEDIGYKQVEAVMEGHLYGNS